MPAVRQAAILSDICHVLALHKATLRVMAGIHRVRHRQRPLFSLL